MYMYFVGVIFFAKKKKIVLINKIDSSEFSNN